jgi:hypothetical protein
MRRLASWLGVWAAVAASACALENPSQIVPTPDVPPPDMGVVVPPDSGTPCPAGRDDCDGNPSNGCEADLTSVMHCGACGVACTGGANATAACTRGRCVQQCAEGFGDCDSNPDNGCETDVRVSPAHCGRCGVACTASGATPTCRAGVCGVSSCAAGRGDCDGMEANGCETVLADDVRHCGTCGRVCTVPNGTPSCNAGVCGIAGCAAGFNNCDGNPENGCETDTRSALSHCGTCGNVCPAGANAAARCDTGRCGLACNMGFDDCDGAPGNGCEVDTRTSPLHCGACGTACVAPANGTTSCMAGQCAPRCNTGFVLDGGMCVACGGVGQRPCTGMCPAGTVLVGGVCVACGAVGQRPCAGGTCPTGSVLVGELCVACGAVGQRPCAGGTCAMGAVAQGDLCVACGAAGQVPCAGGVCNAGLVVSAGRCIACGVAGLPPCAPMPCPGPELILCGGVCRNYFFDTQHCGACGNTCGGSVRCSVGSCNNGFCGTRGRECCPSRMCSSGTPTDVSLGEGRTACVCR